VSGEKGLEGGASSRWILKRETLLKNLGREKNHPRGLVNNGPGLTCARNQVFSCMHTWKPAMPRLSFSTGGWRACMHNTMTSLSTILKQC
jgi:hypothetical protein